VTTQAAPAPLGGSGEPRRRGGRLRRVAGSLRFRLTATYVLLVAILLAALGTYQYLALQNNLVNNRVDSLRGDLVAGTDLLKRIAASIKQPATPTAATDLARARQLRDNLCTGVADHATNGAAIAPVLRSEALACAVSKSSGRTVDVVVFDRNLDALANAGSAPANIPRLDSGGLQQALGSGTSSAQVLSTNSGNELAVAFTITNGTADTPVGLAQLSTTTNPIDSVLTTERLQLLVGGSAVLLLAALAGVLLTGRALAPLRRLTETARRLAGGDLRARSHLTPRDDEVGELAHSFDDMAERIEAAFAVQQQSEARMRRFIADASHELRTPVTALKGYIDVLRRGAAREPEALNAALEAMGRESERLRVLVLDLLTLARVDAQRDQEVQPVELDAVVGAVLDEGAPGMPDQVERNLVSGAEVLADRQSLATIARNLLVNACKYAPGARQAWTTFADGDRAGFRVADEGPGIPAGDLPHVFERFYRGEKTRAREEGGSGLGLSIVQGLARALGGEVEIESADGKGTAVTVWLPVVHKASGKTVTTFSHQPM
jgi:two-component system OmpR family sensor kinase